MKPDSGATRRALLKAGLLAPAILVAGRPTGFVTAQAQTGQTGETEVSTVEDLMREHGVLRRVLIIYREALRRIDLKADFAPAPVAGAARLVRRFVEDYHEKLEEDYLFPRLRKAGRLVDLVNMLEDQHRKGRTLTADIEKLAAGGAMKSADDRSRLQRDLQLFARMYEPHAAREDTVLFPAFKQIVSPKEYDALDDEFEKKEQQMFGKDGFETSVEEVAGLEKQMGVYDLAQFTPPV